MSRPNWPRCPRCRKQNVEIIEVWDVSTIAWGPESKEDDGIMEPGDARKVEGHCLNCGKGWTIRGVIQINPSWFIEQLKGQL